MENIKSYTTKLDSYKQIISLLSGNNESLNKVSRFQNAAGKLSTNQKKLVDLQPLLNKDITSSEKIRNKRRTELIEKMMPVIRIMQVFAVDKKKKKLQKQLDYLTLEYIENCSDNKLIKFAKKIWLTAIKYGEFPTSFISMVKTSLNPDKAKTNIKFKKEYGLMPDMIKNIEESNIKFIESMLLYQGELKEKEKVAMKMKKINKQTENLISNKLDRFALLYEKQNPNFFLEYRVLREKQEIKGKQETKGKQEPKDTIETSSREADQKNSMNAEKKVNPTEPKLAPRTPQNLNPEKR